MPFFFILMMMMIVAARACDSMDKLVDSNSSNAATFTCCDFQGIFQPGVFVGESLLSQLVVYWGKLVSHDIARTVNASFAASNPRFASSNATLCLEHYEDTAVCMNKTANLATPEIDAGFLYNKSQYLRDGGKCEFLQFDNELPRICDPSVLRFQNINGSVTTCAGDPRSSESLQLLSLHMLLIAEHNRHCKSIRQKNRFHNEDVLFAHAQSRIVALVQKISMYEWLPAITNRRMDIPYTHAHPSGAETFAESADVFALLEYMQASSVPFAESAGQTSYIPAWEGYYEPDMLHSGFSDGGRDYCDVLYGMMQQPLARLGLQMSQVGHPAEDCQRDRDAGIKTFQEILHTILSTFAPLSVSTAELYAADTLTDIATNTAILARIRHLYAQSDADIMQHMDLLTGLLVEDHGPAERDIMGPLARYLLTLQMVRTRDGDPNWYERIHTREYVNEINDDNGFIELVERHCRRAYNHHKFKTAMHLIHTVQPTATAEAPPSTFDTHVNDASLITFIVIIAVLTILLIVLLYVVLTRTKAKSQ